MTQPHSPQQSLVSENTRKMMEAAKARGRRTRCRHITIQSPSGKLGGFKSIRDCATYFRIIPITMEARLRRSYENGGHPGWPIEGREEGLYRAWFTDKGDPGMGRQDQPTTPQS